MKIYPLTIKQLAKLCIEGHHEALFNELNRHYHFTPDSWGDECEDGTAMLGCEHMGLNWLIFAKAGRIIDSDMDNL